MGFKRPDDATPSYEKVRGRLSPAGKFTNDPVGKNWRPKQDAAPDPEHNEAAPPSDAVAPAVDPPSRVPEPSPAPEPTPPPLAAVAPSPAVQAEAAPKKALPKPASTEKSSGEAFAQSPSVKSEAVTLKGWVPYPASGQIRCTIGLSRPTAKNAHSSSFYTRPSQLIVRPFCPVKWINRWSNTNNRRAGA